MNHSWTIADADGVEIYRAVVQDAREGRCKKPATANAAHFIGITQRSGAQNEPIPVCEGGRSFASASGAIAVGDAVNISGSLGKLQSCQADFEAADGAIAPLYVVGFARTPAAADGDIFEVEVHPALVKTP